MFKKHAMKLLAEFPFLGFTLVLAAYIIPNEARRLLLTHGADYEAYKSRVKRWGLVLVSARRGSKSWLGRWRGQPCAWKVATGR